MTTEPRKQRQQGGRTSRGNRRIATKVSCLSLFVIAIFAIHNLVTNDVKEFTRKLLSSSSGDESQKLGLDANPTAPLRIERMPLDKIRYATFGTSIAHGSGLEDMTDAFIYQLSPDASNFAIPATGAEYPSKCLSSIIGDQVFDVIVLEFTGRVNKATHALARRLRQRFPDAIIISLKNWVPNMIRSEIFNYDAMSLALKYNFSQNFIHDPYFHKFIKTLGNNDWKIDWRGSNEIESEMEQQLSVKILHLGYEGDDPHEWLSHSERFSKDSFHLSEKGHEELVIRIKEIVYQVGVSANPRVNDFAHKDICKSWFLSGDIGENVSYGKNGMMHQLPFNMKKHVLSFKNPGGRITLNNVASEAQHLYISYMTSGPLPSAYPTTVIQVGTDIEEITLNPDPPGNWGEKYVHLPREAYIGKVEPGKVTLLFRPLEKTEYPFSLVSYVFSPEMVE